MQTFGPYELLQRIGQGGMGEIYLAVLNRPGSFQKTVALKRILPGAEADPEFLRMFQREARVAALLNHQNIVQVYDYGREGDAFFLAMEYVEGADLGTLLARLGSPELAASLAILTGLARALDYAHRRTDREGRALAIVHRDVSPGNVLLSREGEVKLTDFGLVTGFPDEHRSEAGVLKGKFAYISPEQAAGAAVDARADLFSLGVMAYELLAGRRPFRGTLLETLMAIKDGRYEPLSTGIAEPLRQLVHRCLACRREDRPATAAEVLSRLEALPEAGSDAPARLAEWVRRGCGDAVRLPATPERTEVGEAPFRDPSAEDAEGVPAPLTPTAAGAESASIEAPEPAAAPQRWRGRRRAVGWTVALLAAGSLVLLLRGVLDEPEVAERDAGQGSPERLAEPSAAMAPADVSEPIAVARETPDSEEEPPEPVRPPAAEAASAAAADTVLQASSVAIQQAEAAPPTVAAVERRPSAYTARWRSRDPGLQLSGGGPLAIAADGTEHHLAFSHADSGYRGTLGARLVPRGDTFRLELFVWSYPWSVVEVAGQRVEGTPAPLVVEDLRPGRVALRLWPLGQGEGHALELSIQPQTD